MKTGDKFTTKRYGEIIVLEYRGCFDVDIMFTATGYTKAVRKEHILLGSIRDPLHPKILGVGFFGEEKVRYDNHSTIYGVWRNILERCYGKDKRPAYANVVVCEEWHNFQNFASWYHQRLTELARGCVYHVDKDILSKSPNKMYSEGTCCLVPPEINSLILKNEGLRGKYPIGVHLNRVKGKYIAQMMEYSSKVQIGEYNTSEEAFCAYKICKERHIKRVAKSYYEQRKITLEVMNRLFELEVTETD